MAQNESSGTGITPEQMKELLTAVIKAVKEPTVLEQQEIDKKKLKDDQAQVARASNAKGVLQEAANKKINQRLCSHESTDPNGLTHSHLVYIKEPTGVGYILCQKLQCVIRSGVASPNYKGNVIYDTDLFNRLFQKCAMRDNLFG